MSDASEAPGGDAWTAFSGAGEPRRLDWDTPSGVPAPAGDRETDSGSRERSGSKRSPKRLRRERVKALPPDDQTDSTVSAGTRPTASAASPQASAGGGLGDLFDDDQPGGAVVAREPNEASRPRPAATGALGDLFDDDVAVEPDAVEPDAVEPGAVEPGAVQPGAEESPNELAGDDRAESPTTGSGGSEAEAASRTSADRADVEVGENDEKPGGEAVEDEAVEDEAVEDEAVEDEAVEDDAVEDDVEETPDAPEVTATTSFSSWEMASDDDAGRDRTVEAVDDLFADDTTTDRGVGGEDADAAGLLHQGPSANLFSDSDHVAKERKAVERLGRRYQEVDERLWRVVYRLLGFFQNDDELQAFTQRINLTRDHVIDSAQRAEMEELLTPHLAGVSLPLAKSEDFDLAMDLAYDELLKISVLGPYWRDDDVTEICVDSWDRIAVERNGVLLETPTQFRGATHLNEIARALGSLVSDRGVGPETPLAGAVLEGARIQFVYGKIVDGGLAVTIRKFRSLLDFDQLLANRTFSDEMAEFFHDIVSAKANVLVSGGTGTGKTTIINGLSSFIPSQERVITIEDARELQLANIHWVPLQSTEKATADDRTSVTGADLLKASLRMRPDRIIVGEVREGEAAEAMLLAANTGHEGTMCTVHANSPAQALNFRLPTAVRKVSAVPSDTVITEISLAMNLVIQISRKSGVRFIEEVAVVDASTIHNELIEPEPVFVGNLGADGIPEFRRVGSVRGDTELGRKLQEAGFDRWLDESAQPSDPGADR